MFLNLYQLAWAAITQCHGLNGLRLFCHGSGDGESDIRMPTWLPPSEAYFPDIDGCFLTVSTSWQTAESGLCGVSSYKGTDPSGSQPHDLI